MSDHRLDYKHTPGGSLFAVCQCNDFRVWIEQDDLAAELALLELHQIHVDHPELGRPQ